MQHTARHSGRAARWGARPLVAVAVPAAGAAAARAGSRLPIPGVGGGLRTDGGKDGQSALGALAGADRARGGGIAVGASAHALKAVVAVEAMIFVDRHGAVSLQASG